MLTLRRSKTFGYSLNKAPHTTLLYPSATNDWRPSAAIGVVMLALMNGEATEPFPTLEEQRSHTHIHSLTYPLTGYIDASDVTATNTSFWANRFEGRQVTITDGEWGEQAEEEANHTHTRHISISTL